MYFKKQKRAVYRFSTFCTDFYLISVVAGNKVASWYFCPVSVCWNENETVLTLQVLVLWTNRIYLTFPLLLMRFANCSQTLTNGIIIPSALDHCVFEPLWKAGTDLNFVERGKMRHSDRSIWWAWHPVGIRFCAWCHSAFSLISYYTAWAPWYKIKVRWMIGLVLFFSSLYRFVCMSNTIICARFDNAC